MIEWARDVEDPGRDVTYARGYYVFEKPEADHFPDPFHHCSTILSALGPDHALMVLFLGTHEQLPSGSPIMGLLSRVTRLTSEFR
ncbi:hypothetical protein DVH24_030467 [Malus domestica]|uniref:Uncharacterized protein n=1 Tax=Malus domestica TaxID=3750 RepID=A0A498JXZ7_MALDO|nr:hypothetical protein DVH24_030467 [Malus domestica]